MSPRGAGARRRALLPALLTPLGWAAPFALGAQGAPALPDERCERPRAAASHEWPAPLGRPVTLRAEDATLRVALDRLAAESGIRLSYSPDLLPLDRAACVVPATVPAGDALVALLAGTGVAPVPAGGGVVVLAPMRAAASSTATPEPARAARQLERVVVTGTATGAPERGSPFALTVVGSSRVDLQACKLEYSIVSPK